MVMTPAWYVTYFDKEYASYEGGFHILKSWVMQRFLHFHDIFNRSSCYTGIEGGCMRLKILIIEDDIAIAQLIEMTLRVSDYETCICYDGAEAEKLLVVGQFDLVILDVMLPGLNGFELVEHMNQRKQTLPPILYLTAKIDVQDGVRGLRLGAEDYMLKPFHPLELQARVDGILRRHNPMEERYQVLDVSLNISTREVTRDGEAVEVTPQEFDLLHTLMRHKNMALSREQLLQAAWGYDYLGGTRTVDMHVQRLRRKLHWEDTIKTVFKLGYRLEAKG